MADRKVSVDIIANDRASKAIEKVGGGFGRLGEIAGGVGKSIAVGAGVVAAGGIAALGGALVRGVKDAADYQTLAAKTAAVLKSTGNAAGTSVKHIQDLAGSLESMSGVDETLIVNSQNVLATFTDIRNEAGKGNDVFDQATKAALDISTALGSDLQGASIQVGKALNDPIKGVSALSRVGVSFTAAQKKQIKALVESGDKMGAQKIILKELNKEFGGAAKAAGSGFNGAMARLKDVVGDTGRAVGQALLPYLQKAADWLSKKLPIAAQWITDHLPQGIELAKTAIARFTAGIKRGVSAVQSTVAFLKKWSDVLVPVASGVLAIVAAWKVYTTVTKVAAAVTKAYAAVQAALNVILDANPIGLIILAVIGLATAFVVAYKKSATFRAIVNGALHAVGAAFTWLWTGAKKVFDGIGHALSSVGSAVKGFFVSAWAWAIRKVVGFLGWIIDGAANAFGWLPGIGDQLKGAQKAFHKFADGVNAELDRIQNKNITVTVNGKKLGWNKDTGVATVNNKPIPDAFRAAGGPVSRGQSYIVGEHGPEVFVPGSTGTVIPNHALMPAPAGGGVSVVVPVTVHAGAVASQQQLARTITDALVQAFKSGQISPALLGRTLQTAG